MACLTTLDPKGAIFPEDPSAYYTVPHKVTANLGPEKPQLSPRRGNSPKGNHLPPNPRRAYSHQSSIHSHSKEFHAESADDHLTGCHRGSKLNSASHVKLWLHPGRSSDSSSSEVKTTQRFIPYFNPTKQSHTLPKPSDIAHLSDKSSKPRKRTIILKPKCPKYQGLSNFAAPVDLVSDMIPCNDTNKVEKPNSPSLKSVSGLATEKMSLENKTTTDSVNTDAHPTEENSQTPVDFLKNLSFEEWDQRKQDLSQMVEDRKSLFLQIGFAATSGKPFQPDEQAIEKKPVPNRWVWYMHLSTDYDKFKNTRVPPGGPAGYLKYGWDRLGPAGKQPYQELADIYSAQRLKYMAAHGITEESAKKKSKHAEKPKPQRYSPQDFMISADNNTTGLINGPLRPNGKMTLSIKKSTEEISNPSSNFHIDMPFVPIQPILQYNLLCQQFNPFVQEKLNYNYANGPAEMFEMSEASSYPNYLRSPEMSSDYFSPFYSESGYGPQLSSDTIQPLGTPIRLPSSPNEYSFSCNPIFPCQAPSEFQSRYTLSPESIHSAQSEMTGLFSTSCIDNGSSLSSAFSTLQPSNSLCESFDHHDMDFPALNS